MEFDLGLLLKGEEGEGIELLMTRISNWFLCVLATSRSIEGVSCNSQSYGGNVHGKMLGVAWLVGYFRKLLRLVQ